MSEILPPSYSLVTATPPQIIQRPNYPTNLLYTEIDCPAGDSLHHQLQQQLQSESQGEIKRENPRQTVTATFCCCQLKAWTKAIAVIHIFISGAVLVSTYFITVEYSLLMQRDYRRTLADDAIKGLSLLIDYRTRIPKPILPYDIPDKNTLLFLGILGFFNLSLGCILFAGAHYGKSRLLFTWMLASGMEIKLYIFFMLRLFVNERLSGCQYFLLLAALVMMGLFFATVYVHRQVLIDLRHENEYQQRLIQI